jgi:arylsulfatase A-like enzyme
MSTSSVGTAVIPDEPSAKAVTAPVQVAAVEGPPSRWRRIGRRSLEGIRFVLGAALGLWLGDALILLYSRGGASWSQWLTGIGAALFVVTTSAVVVGALLGPVVGPVLERVRDSLRAWWVRLDGAGGDRSRALAAVSLAAIVLTSVWSVVASRIVGDILFGFARPDTTELALVASHVAFTATLVVAWPLGLRAARFVVDAGSKLRPLRWVLARTWRVVACFAFPVVGAGVAGAIVYRHELGAISWLALAPLALVIPGIVLLRDLPRARAPWGRRLSGAGLGLLGVAFAAASFAALRLRPESTTAQIIGFDRAWSGRLGYSAWVFALDFDRDGQINVLGGGDCAPFNAHRHAGATDIPGNRIDEDCDGVDSTPQSIRPRGRVFMPPGKIPTHPNIVFITVDALGAPRLSALGSPVPLMPNVDKLAASSMLFTHAFSQGPSTRLSFPSMFTSRWDSQLVFSFAPRIPYSVGPKEKQIQDLVDDAGYDTVAVVPNQYFEKARWPSMTRGFQQVDTSALSAGKHNAPQVTDAALRVLSEQRDRPLYMWLHYYDAHPPYNPIAGVQYAERSDLAYYEAELRYIDRELGRLLDALAKRPDPTYIVFTADHSTVFHPNPESRKFHYGYDLYTATLHVPLIVHGPGIAPGRVEDPVSTMDIAPTLLDLMKISVPAQFNGTSLLPELFEGQHDPKRYLFHEYYLPEFILRGKDPLQIVSVRDAHWDLILDRDRGIYELYDWPSDYFEQHDLYETMALTQEVGHLRSMLGSFLLQFDNRPDLAALGPPVPPPGEKMEP